MSDPEEGKSGSSIFKSLDGSVAQDEPKVVVYEARIAGTVGIQPAQFPSISSTGAYGQESSSGADDGQGPESEQTIEERLAEAENAGYQRGLTEGQSASKEQHEQVLTELRETLEKLEAGVRSSEGMLAQEAIQLALQISEKVIRKSLGKDAAILGTNLASVLETGNTNEPIRVLCHPDFVETLRTQMMNLAQRLQITEWVVEEDHDLQAGDLLVTFGPATVDARISHRLERIEQALYRELGLESHEGNIQ